MSDPIIIRGARENNLKNVSLDIPSEKLVVVTGPSGSGKSSLAFDTVYSEGQRRYVESLSNYARQFLEQLPKPDVDFIDGLSPAIAIDQKTISAHPRSTVGTVTSIYNFIRLLYARKGEIIDRDTGETLSSHSNEDIIDHISSFPKNTKIKLYAFTVRGQKGEFLREFEKWRRLGFSKVIIDKEERSLFDPILISRYQNHEIDVLIDSFSLTEKNKDQGKILEALKIADEIAQGHLKLKNIDTGEEKVFSRKIANSTTGESFPDLEPRLFSFNSPYGMCKDCKGIGLVENKIKTKIKKSELDDELDFFKEENVLVTCHSCKGARLKKESLQVFFNDKNIHELTEMSCFELLNFFTNELTEKNKKHPVVDRLSFEIIAKLRFLINVGVGYLSLGRKTSTLSGGEAQRLRLATQLGSELSGVLYVLDEPSIGLHPSDHEKLLASLKRLRDLGNSVIVVEHDEETILAADYLIDVGPGAGKLGGNIITHGLPDKVIKNKKSITANYLSGRSVVSEKTVPRKGNGKHIEISGCTGNNLKNVDVKLPLGKFIVCTGASGSGKSSLFRDTLEVAIASKLYRSQKKPLPFKNISGLEHIDKLVHVDQKAIGRSSRSNPATYTGVFSPIRNLFSKTTEAQIRGYNPGTFSFNVKGGRCDDCEGAGRKKLEMHFMPNAFITCETCQNKRYRKEVLEAMFKGKNIDDVLSMNIDESFKLFENQPTIAPKLKAMIDVGLGYLTLGQSATTLSGGEAQRIKLAKELCKRSTGKTIYFLDEPTTGLHFNDIKKLVELLQRLCNMGNTIVVIEHNMDIICAADWLIDIGPGAGNNGGQIVFEGTPEEISKSKKVKSKTAPYVKEYFKRRKWQ